MDPLLVEAIRKLVAARSAAQRSLGAAGGSPIAQSDATANAAAKPGVPMFSPAEEEAFMREETQGKYGQADAAKYLATVNPGITPSNVARSAIQGPLMNFADEFLGKVPKALGGGAGAEADMRLRAAAFHQAHPILDNLLPMGATAAAAAGAGLLAGPEAAVGVGGAMLRGGATGAVVGGLSSAGASEGDALDRVKAGAVGAAGGGLLGAVAPAAVWAVGGLFRPSNRAMNLMKYAATNSEGGIPGLQSALNALKAGGKGDIATLADLSDPLRAQADFAANNSDLIRGKMAKMGGTRQAGASERLLNTSQDLLGGNQYAPQRIADLEASKSAWAAGPNGYGGIRAARPQIQLGDLAQEFNKPELSGAWSLARKADNIGAQDPLAQMIAKVKAANPGLSDAEARTGAEKFADLAGVKAGPRAASFTDLHDMKQILDDRATSAFNAGRGNVGRAYASLRDAVDQSLSDQVPAYAGVNAEYAARTRLEKAVQAGHDAWDAEDTRGLAAQTAALSPAELQEFRNGMASHFQSDLRSVTTNRNAAAKFVNPATGEVSSPALEDKLKTVFGDQATFMKFMQSANGESELAKLAPAYGGSATHRRGEASGMNPAEMVVAEGLFGHAGLSGVALKNMLKSAAANSLKRNTAEQAGNMLMTKGAPGIEQFLESLKNRSVQFGRTSTAIAPAAAGRVPSIFQQDPDPQP